MNSYRKHIHYIAPDDVYRNYDNTHVRATHTSTITHTHSTHRVSYITPSFVRNSSRIHVPIIACSRTGAERFLCGYRRRCGLRSVTEGGDSLACGAHCSERSEIPGDSPTIADEGGGGALSGGGPGCGLGEFGGNVVVQQFDSTAHWRCWRVSRGPGTGSPTCGLRASWFKADILVAQLQTVKVDHWATPSASKVLQTIHRLGQVCHHLVRTIPRPMKFL